MGWWSSIRAVATAPLGYIRSVHSEASPDSHGRWTVTAYMLTAAGILGHAEHVGRALDPTLSTTLLGIGALVVGRATASKVFAEKSDPQQLPPAQP